eukprot:6141210-Pleurochrysis_carterae.AAC.1
MTSGGRYGRPWRSCWYSRRFVPMQAYPKGKSVKPASRRLHISRFTPGEAANKVATHSSAFVLRILSRSSSVHPL